MNRGPTRTTNVRVSKTLSWHLRSYSIKVAHLPKATIWATLVKANGSITQGANAGMVYPFPCKGSYFKWALQTRKTLKRWYATSTLTSKSHLMKRKSLDPPKSGQTSIEPSNSDASFTSRYTVRLLTHILCKPTHLFFHPFITTMSYPLQTSFNSVMKDWADKYHVWGTPTRSPSRSNSR